MPPAIAAPPSSWHEIHLPDGSPRALYAKLLRDLGELRAADFRALDDRMEATLREMGVNFDITRSDPWGRQPWTCDLLPHLFEAQDWALIVRGFRQRLHAFELFLADVYGPRDILRAGVVPIQAVLGSPHYQHAASGLPLPHGRFLHLSGMCLARDPKGRLQVKHHHFGHATGISYMMQNRRALARVVPEFFQDAPVLPLAETPLAIMERLRETTRDAEPTVVLLSPGAGSAVSSEQSFLARRMGIPVVQGGDLLVLDDRVFLKTVRGLERVEVIYNRVADAYLDPLVFRSDSYLGVPGLLHCVRKGTVSLLNAVGSQLADDRALLAFAPQIIRHYLGEAPILPTVPTIWLGDIDQLELVLDDPARYRIRPVSREDTSGSWERAHAQDPAHVVADVRRNPAHFVAQPREEGAPTLCFERGQRVEHRQDHIVFAVRSGGESESVQVFPGALTRVFSRADPAGEFGFGWTSKDSWVPGEPGVSSPLSVVSRRASDPALPTRQVTSRVAESFYWMGRYLERAHHQAYLIQTIEALETEELNTAERRLYRPIWNKLLPPLEKSAGTSRRSIANRLDRYRLLLSPEPGSVLRTFQRAMYNAESVQDSLSPEAWATLARLRATFARTRFSEKIPADQLVRVTRRQADQVTQLIPQFLAVAAGTMLADDGWAFCQIGLMLERAVITANSVLSIAPALQAPSAAESSHAGEIELSAFLRLLGCRDAYRRIYQMRAEPIPVLELLYQHAQVPRSVVRCLERCAQLLRESVAPEQASAAGAPAALDSLITMLQRLHWPAHLRHGADEDAPLAPGPAASRDETAALAPLLQRLLGQVLEIHTHLADSFLNHQAHIARLTQPMLPGV